MWDGWTLLNQRLIGTGAIGRPEKSPPEATPALQGLARPDPHAGGDAHRQGHEVFEHQHGVERLLAGSLHLGTWAGQGLDPVLEVGRLVQIATDHDGGWDRVEYREDSNADHQLLQFVRLDAGSHAALLLDHRAYPEQGHEAGHQEGGANYEVNEERSQHEGLQVVRVEVAHVADAQNGISVDGRQQEHSHRLDSGNEPGGQVEVLGVLGNGLVAPLQAGGQEPGEAQDHPPDGGGHAEEVGQQEDQSTRVRSGGALPEQ